MMFFLIALPPNAYGFQFINQAKILPANILFGSSQKVSKLKVKINLKLKIEENERNIGNLGSPRQVFKGKADHESVSGEVTIKARVAPPETTLDFPVEKWKSYWEHYLKSTKLIQARDVEIVRQAKIITKDSKNTWQAARAVSAWVYKHIDYQELELKSAKQTLRSGKGKCTEMSLLAVALCRAVKLPARLVTGYVYLENTFQAHAWIEVCVNDQGWTAFDPALGQFDFVDATHIGITTSPVWESSFFGENKIEILAYEPIQAGAIAKEFPLNLETIWKKEETRTYVVNDNGKNSGSYQAKLKTIWNGEYLLTEKLILPDVLTKIDSELVLNKQGFALRYHTVGKWCNQQSNWQLNYGNQLKIAGFFGKKKSEEKQIPRISQTEMQADLLRFAQWGLVIWRITAGVTQETKKYITVYTPDTFTYTNLEVIITPTKIEFQNKQISGWTAQISGAQYLCKLELTKNGLLTSMELPEIQITAKLKARSLK